MLFWPYKKELQPLKRVYTLSGLRRSAVCRGGRFGKELGGDQPGHWVERREATCPVLRKALWLAAMNAVIVSVDLYVVKKCLIFLQVGNSVS